MTQAGLISAANFSKIPDIRIQLLSETQFVAVLSTIQLRESSSTFGLVIDISEAVNRLVDSSKFGDCLTQNVTLA
jgi:hypothetical protein